MMHPNSLGSNGTTCTPAKMCPRTSKPWPSSIIASPTPIIPNTGAASPTCRKLPSDEMVCDWFARSQEFGTDLRQWITDQAIPHASTSPRTASSAAGSIALSIFY